MEPNTTTSKSAKNRYLRSKLASHLSQDKIHSLTPHSRILLSLFDTSLLLSSMENSLSHILATVLLLLVASLTVFPTIESVCSDSMATTLSSSGFSLFAQALHAHSLTPNATAGLTYLAPPDDALFNHPLDAATVRGHVSKAGAFHYETLLSIPPNTTFPTLHNTKLIVGTDGERVSFNDVLVVLPNLYFDGFCAVHGIARPLLPISPSSSIDDQTFAKPRMENKRSPMSKRRRARGIFKEYVRFIRRVNHPIPVDENKDSRNP